MRTYKYYLSESGYKVANKLGYTPAIHRRSTRFNATGTIKYWNNGSYKWFPFASSIPIGELKEITYEDFIKLECSKQKCYSKMLIEWQRIVKQTRTI